MNKKLKSTLKKRNWSDKEIAKAKKIMHKKETSKTRYHKTIDNFIEYLILTSGSLLALGVGFLFIPLMLILTGFTFFLILFTITICIGFFWASLAIHLMHYEKKHHILFIAAIPIVAGSTIYFTATQTNKLIEALFLTTKQHNPLILAIIYGATIIIPYIALYQLNKKDL